jgi:type I restriction enzyme, S subunit
VSARFRTEDFVFLTEDKANELSNANAFPGDLVFTHRGTLGQVGLIPAKPYPRYVVSQSQMKLTCDPDKADSLFLYFFKSPAGQHSLLMHTSQTGVPAISRPVTSLKSVRLALPEISEQRTIASVLGALDDKIELNRRMNETLETMARAIFKDWFVDFGPTRAKMEGRSAYLAYDLWSMFPDNLDDDDNPEGWYFGILEDILEEIETGGRPKGGVSSYTSGIPSIGAESIVGLGKFDYAKTRYVSQEFFDAMRRGHVKNRDVLLYKDGGRPGQFEPHLTLVGDGFPFDTFAINEHVYRLRVTPGYGQNLLYFWLSSELVMEEMRVKGTGVAIPGLNSTQVKSLTTLMPASPVATAFGNLINPSMTRILSNCNESKSLAQTRDLLLPKLMSGEIRLRKAEKLVEKVA